MRNNRQAPWHKTLKFKRGGSSGGGGGSNSGASSETKENASSNQFYDENPTGTHSYDTSEEGVSKQLGISASEARESMAAIYTYTMASDTIRESDKTNPKDPEVQAIYKFLQKAPKYKGEVYRGVKLPDQDSFNQFIDRFQVGKTNELKAMSSFSSSLDVAKRFSKKGQGKYPVVIYVASNHSGTSIKKLSNYPNENEVLVPKGAKYRTLKIENNKGITNIYVEEVK
jgi:hypothetical protein